MRISVIAVGRLKPGAEKDLAEDYRKRAAGLGRKAGVTKLDATEFPESREANAPSRIAEEAKLITGALPPDAFVIALDERGKSMASAAFADALTRQIDGGTQDIAFVIGGPDGLSPGIRERADLLLAFGAMTWPHRLVRVMLLEQIYRAVTIMVNHPYHRP